MTFHTGVPTVSHRNFPVQSQGSLRGFLEASWIVEHVPVRSVIGKRETSSNLKHVPVRSNSVASES